ncbi:MAG TPA: hypothetical protein VKT77_15965, partial [Chthonomonadaceae bacterium]|nr:hypothetical protein [Chthonomonadaceae bacterium]
MFNTTSPSDSVSFAQPLLDCLRVDEGGPTQADLAVLGSSQPGFDDLIDRQRVGPLLLHRLRACGLDRAFHPDCLTRLELARTDCLHRNLRIYSEARRILRA